MLAIRLLQPLNDEVVVATPREALGAALRLDIVPRHFHEDFSTCLGLVRASDGEVAAAANRLGRELLAFLRERRPDVDSQPGASQYLADGTFERHLGYSD